MRWQSPIRLLLGLAPMVALGQSPGRSWYAGLEAQFSAPLLPATSMGVFVQYSLPHSSRFALSLNGSVAAEVTKGAGVACTQSSNCDGRVIDRYVIGTARGSYTMSSGESGPELGVFVGAGAYASSLDADGTYAAGAGPSSSLFEAGVLGATSRSSSVLVEAAVRRLANVGPVGATAIAIKIGVRW